MLARTVLTAAELKITDVELTALLAVREALKSGEIKPHNFDMNVWRDDQCETRHDRVVGCGTVGCIGGYMQLEKAWGPGNLIASADDFVEPNMRDTVYSKALYPLFFPPHDRRTILGAEFIERDKVMLYKEGWDVTPGQAVEAIDSFLSGAQDPWNHLPVVRVGDRLAKMEQLWKDHESKVSAAGK